VATTRSSARVARALVWPDGEIEEVEDARGARLLDAAPPLVRYATALPGSGAMRVAFAWVEPHEPWILASLSCFAPGGDEQLAVRVELDVRPTPPCSLTQRELDVLTLLCGGLSNPDISDRLYTSRSTVATHVERVLAKLGQRNRAGAVAVALEAGLVRLPIPGGQGGFEHLAIGALEAATCAPGTPPKPPIVRSGVGTRPVLIGIAVPEKGLVGSDRDEYMNGAELAITEVNERGGVTERALEWLPVDFDTDSSASVEDAFRQLVAADVDVLMFDYAWIEDASTFQTVSEYGCPVLTSMESDRLGHWVSADPQSLGRIFQVSSVWTHYGAAFFQELSAFEQAGHWKPPNRRLVCVETKVGAGQVFDEAAAATAKQLDWQVERILEVSTRNADWDAALATIRKRRPAVALITHFVPAELALFQRLFVQDPSDTLVYCIYAPSLPAYHDQAGAAAEGVVWSTVNGTYSDDIGKAFLERYEAHFGRPPGRSLAGIAYDQVNLMVNAWARAGNPRSFERVAQELRSGMHRGVSGVYSLGNPRQTALAYPHDTLDPSTSHAALVFQIQDGENRIISPALYAESTLRTPAWFAT
jgi:branched-chain amino acid transport system substrate-binding protein